MFRTHAAVAREPGSVFVIEEVDLAEPRPDEVLVKIEAVGICHTDLVFSERLGIMKPPAVLGHEGAGVVQAVGAAVSHVAPGDHVILTFNSCGTCRRCSHGRPAYCDHFASLNYGAARADGSATISIDGAPASANFFGQSSFAGHALAHARNVVRIDRDLPLALMAPLGCGLQTGAGAIANSFDCKAGSSVLVVGAGAVGLGAVMAARIRDCARIVVLEPRPERRALALDLGATDAIDPANADFVTAVREIAAGGVEYVLDTSGIIEVIEQVAATLAPRGILGLVGVPADPAGSIGLPLNRVIGAGHIFMGIIEGDSRPDEFIPLMIRWYREGHFPLERLVATYPLADINLAIADQQRGLCVKPVLIPS